MELIAGVKTKELKVIPDERGHLQELLRKDDDFFTEFGQVYATTTHSGVVKGWHYHEEQSDNVACIRGMIKLVLYDDRKDSKTKGKINEFFLGDQGPKLVHIPNGVYHGWKGIGEGTAYIINIPDKVYNYKKPDEHRVDPHKNDIPYDWAQKDG